MQAYIPNTALTEGDQALQTSELADDTIHTQESASDYEVRVVVDPEQTSNLVDLSGFTVTNSSQPEFYTDHLREQVERAKTKRWYEQSTGFADMTGAGDSGQSMITSSTEQKVKIDDIVDNIPELMKDREYLKKTAWQMSLTGSVVRGTFDVELDKFREDRLGVGDKIGRAALAMGPDFWLMGLGGAIYPGVRAAAAGAGAAGKLFPVLKSYPVMLRAATGTETAAASFGFFEGARQYYFERLAKEGQAGKPGFINEWGRITYEALKGAASGAMFGAGHANRAKILMDAKDPIMGFAKSMGALVPEAFAIASVQSQLHNPLVLPGADEFAESFGFILGMETFGGVKRAIPMMGELAATNGIFRQLAKGYIRNGRHPYSVAADAKRDITVAEDLLSQTADGIRAYDRAGGVPDAPNPVLAELDTLKTQLRTGAILERSEGIPAEGSKPQTEWPGNIVPDKTGETAKATGATPAPTTSTPSQPVARQVVTPPAGVEMPIQIFEGDPYEIVTTPNGKRVLKPTSYENSLSMSTEGLIDLPTMIAWGRKLFEHFDFRIKASDTKSDKNLRTDKGTILGYFMPPSSTRAIELENLAKHLKALNGQRKRELRRGHDVSLLDSRIVELTNRHNELAQSELVAEDGRVVLNRVLAEGPVGRQLLTLTHEIGHVLSFFSKHWEQYKTTGLADRFLTTLVSYPRMFQELLDNARVTGMDINELYNEGAFISQLWRPVEDAKFHPNGYRSSGAEMIADVVSVYIQRPDLIDRYAPNLMKAMETYWNARPEMKQRFAELNEFVNTGKDPELVASLLREGFQKGEQAAIETGDADAAAREHRITNAEHNIGGLVFDQFLPALRFFKKNWAVRNKIERFQHISASYRWYTEKMKKRFAEPLRKAGMSEEDIGLVLFFNRVAGDKGRENLFNSLGIDSEYARKQLNAKLDALAQDHRIDLNRPELESLLLREFHEVRKETVIKEMKESGLFSDKHIDLVENNTAYARFDDIQHFLDKVLNGVLVEGGRKRVLTDAEAAALIPSIGSVGQVRNPMAATMEHDLAIIHAVKKTVALRDIVNNLRKTGVAPAFTEHELRGVQMYEPGLMKGYTRDQLKAVQFPERMWVPKLGEHVTELRTYYIPESIADIFLRKPDAVATFFNEIATTSLGEMLSGIKNAKTLEEKGAKVGRAAVKSVMKTNTIFRAFTVLYSAAFLTANMLYDPLRTFANMPKVPYKIEPTDSPLVQHAKKVYNATPFPGKPTMLKYMFTETYDRLKGTFTGDLSDRSLEILEKNLMSEGTRFTEDPTDTTATERLLDKYGPHRYSANVSDKAYGFIDQGATKVSNAFNGFYNVVEGVSKQAAKRLYNESEAKGETNYGEDYIDHVIRTRLGAPAYGRKGTWSTPLNMAFPFINAIKEGVRGDIAAIREAPMEWMATATVMAVIPGIIQALCKVGVFDSTDDEDDKDSLILQLQSQQSLDNNFHVPLAIGQDGKGHTFKIPTSQSPVFRLLFAMSQRLTEAAHELATSQPDDKDAQEALEQLKELAASVAFQGGGMTPQASPAFRIPGKFMDVMLEGNTYSDFRKSMRFGDQGLQGFEERMKGAFQVTAEEMGVWKSLREPGKTLEAMSKALNPAPGSDEGSIARAWQFTRATPFIGDGFNRWLSVSDAGVREKADRLEEKYIQVDRAKKELAQGFLRDDLTPEQIQEFTEKARAGIITEAYLNRTARNLGSNIMKKYGVDPFQNPLLQNYLKSGTRGGRDAWYEMIREQAKNPNNKNAVMAYAIITDVEMAKALKRK